MSKKYTPLVIDFAVPPGDAILEMLEYKGVTQEELAEQMGYPLEQVNRVILGHAPVTPEFAMLYEKTIGTPARILLKMEAHYQEGLAILARNAQLEKEAEMSVKPAYGIENVKLRFGKRKKDFLPGMRKAVV